MKNVAVFFGGSTVEHDVSVITGALTLNSLDKEKYNPIPIYVHEDGRWYTGESLFDVDNFKNLNVKKLQKVFLESGGSALYKIVKDKKIKKLLNIDVAINCLHGERGEDGALAGLLSMSDVALASPKMLPSAVCIDKCFTKTVLKGMRVKTLPSITVKNAEDGYKAMSYFDFPLIVKPALLGSSVGISVAKNEEEFFSAINHALRYGDKVIVEQFMENVIEINCACYFNGKENVVSECERPVGRGGFLTFSDKYSAGERVFPADIDKDIADKIKAVTNKIYTKLELSGVIRIDFFVIGKEIYVNEINTVPGSLAFYLFSDTLKGFSKMLTEIVEDAFVKRLKGASVKRKFSSGVLNFNGSKGAKNKK